MRRCWGGGLAVCLARRSCIRVAWRPLVAAAAASLQPRPPPTPSPSRPKRNAPQETRRALAQLSSAAKTGYLALERLVPQLSAKPQVCVMSFVCMCAGAREGQGYLASSGWSPQRLGAKPQV